MKENYHLGEKDLDADSLDESIVTLDSEDPEDLEHIQKEDLKELVLGQDSLAGVAMLVN